MLRRQAEATNRQSVLHVQNPPEALPAFPRLPLLPVANKFAERSILNYPCQRLIVCDPRHSPVAIGTQTMISAEYVIRTGSATAQAMTRTRLSPCSTSTSPTYSHSTNSTQLLQVAVSWLPT